MGAQVPKIGQIKVPVNSMSLTKERSERVRRRFEAWRVPYSSSRTIPFSPGMEPPTKSTQISFKHADKSSPRHLRFCIERTHGYCWCLTKIGIGLPRLGRWISRVSVFPLSFTLPRRPSKTNLWSQRVNNSRGGSALLLSAVT